jgi:CheY-like chemotaxis protein
MPDRSDSHPATGLPCVLIVDDEVSIRVVLRRFFTRRGWDVYEAEDGETACKLLAPNVGCCFDVLICDLRMPRFSGYEFYRWLSEVRPDAAARLVFTTGDADSAQTGEFLAAAHRPVLTKPFDLRQVGEVVDQIWGTAQAA